MVCFDNSVPTALSHHYPPPLPLAMSSFLAPLHTLFADPPYTHASLHPKPSLSAPRATSPSSQSQVAPVGRGLPGSQRADGSDPQNLPASKAQPNRRPFSGAVAAVLESAWMPALDWMRMRMRMRLVIQQHLGGCAGLGVVSQWPPPPAPSKHMWCHHSGQGVRPIMRPGVLE